MGIVVKLDQMLVLRKVKSRDLAAHVGITEANLSILRTGRCKGIRFATLNRICHYLQCDVGDILTCDGLLEEKEEEDDVS